MNTHRAGRAGEERAAAYLDSKGYTIVEKNFRTPRGEVDIIAVQGATLAFVEVKSWKSFGPAELEYAIGKTKQRRIRLAARAFLGQQPAYSGYRIRFEVVFLNAAGTEIRHLTDVF